MCFVRVHAIHGVAAIHWSSARPTVSPTRPGQVETAYLCLSANDRRPILFVLTIKRTSELTDENAEQVNMQNRTQSYKATIDPGSELPDEAPNFQKVRIPEKSANRP